MSTPPGAHRPRQHIPRSGLLLMQSREPRRSHRLLLPRYAPVRATCARHALCLTRQHTEHVSPHHAIQRVHAAPLLPPSHHLCTHPVGMLTSARGRAGALRRLRARPPRTATRHILERSEAMLNLTLAAPRPAGHERHQLGQDVARGTAVLEVLSEQLLRQPRHVAAVASRELVHARHLLWRHRSVQLAHEVAGKGQLSVRSQVAGGRRDSRLRAGCGIGRSRGGDAASNGARDAGSRGRGGDAASS
mmetsp:Transcript_29820/g.97588  ORF Transcript_29820/g.97588 Transcript_29820/m.97588 type:complete len:247 (-) Transcript_29820:283-1023(-)